MTPAHTRARKRFGQHFLIRPEITQRILGLAELTGGESVLEIGPGRGALTDELRRRCGHLIVIEIDRDLVADLRGKLATDSKVRIIEGDVLKLDLSKELAADAPLTVVANLPYNISTPLLARLVEHPELFGRLVLMLQREVAERICAKPGGKDYGALSVAVQLVADSHIAFGVPPDAFRPRPKVDSAVIVVEPFQTPVLGADERASVRRITRALFSQRRKQLGNLVRRLSPDGPRILEELGIEAKRRPETLSPGDFVRLARAIEDTADDSGHKNMPELPEVETVRRSLEPHVVGRRITSVVVRERRLRRPVAADFESKAAGRSLRSLGRRGKYLLFQLDDGQTILAHLGMSGSFHLRARGTALARHDHVVIEIDGSEDLVLNDPRRFGVMRIGSLESFEELHSIGPDPLSTARSADQWRNEVRGRRTAIKTLLMDQRFLAGIGNIYANEMLFEAGIRPRRMASRLSRRELARLEDAMHRVLDKAVELGGSSISDFRDVRGKPGYFQIYHAVYDRGGEPCPRCSAPIRRIVLVGRSTFYCPSCQS